MAAPSPVGDVEIVSLISTFVLIYIDTEIKLFYFVICFGCLLVFLVDLQCEISLISSCRYIVDVSATKDRKFITINCNSRSTSEVCTLDCEILKSQQNDNFVAVSLLKRASKRRGRKKKESLHLRLWNLNSTFNSPVAPRRLSCGISTNQREAETSANVNKHWKTRAMGNDVITNFISANLESLLRGAWVVSQA